MDLLHEHLLLGDVQVGLRGLSENGGSMVFFLMGENDDKPLDSGIPYIQANP
jgi:hypothetical protein